MPTQARACVIGIELDGLLEKPERLLHVGSGKAVERRAPAKECLVSLIVVRLATPQTVLFLGIPLEIQNTHQLTGNDLFEIRDLGSASLIALAPQEPAVPRVDHLHFEGHRLLAYVDPAGNHHLHIQLSTDATGIDRLAFVLAGRAARRNLQLRQLGQAIE